MRTRSIRERCVHVEVALALRLFVFVVFILAVTSACKDINTTKIRINLADTPQGTPASKRAVGVQPLRPVTCPPIGIAPLQPGAPGTGDHKVFLRWNASVASANSSPVSGYCLYRSVKKIPAKIDVKCLACERINTTPIPGTSCVDNLVQDGKKYFYGAAAIDQNQQLSTTSNQPLVVIPSTPQPVGNPPPGSYPDCRATANSK